MAATMRGVVVEKAEGPYIPTDGIPIPEPTEDQILVKSIAAAVNPV